MTPEEWRKRPWMTLIWDCWLAVIVDPLSDECAVFEMSARGLQANDTEPIKDEAAS